MILVTKGAEPTVLRTSGAAQTESDVRAFNRDPAAYLAGGRKIGIKRSIYAHPSVRDQLVADQHGKCCYCEIEIEHPYEERDVEHWRPKGAVVERTGTPRLYPGYFWLAYDWRNLFLACNVCNRLKKRSRFPLAAGSVRARGPADDLALEAPEILKPDGPVDPEEHIEYVRDVPRGRSPLGDATIRAVGLRRLSDRKRDKVLTELEDARDTVVNLSPLAHLHPTIDRMVRKARVALLRAQEPSSPCSSMAKAFVRDNPVPP